MQKIDDLELTIESTWIEHNQSEFSRIVVFEFWTKDNLMSDSKSNLRTVGDQLRDRIITKLYDDIGLRHYEDYIFAIYDKPEMDNGIWVSAPVYNTNHIVLEFRQEEHFAMLKMHYSN